MTSFSAAQAQFEEYSYFSEKEQDEVNTPSLLDAEYFSDLLTYRLPLSMTETFLTSQRAYNLSIGSLSRSRFATQHRLKIDTPMNDSFLFRLVYNENSDLEESYQHLVLELQYKLNHVMSLVGYTELSHQKKFNDVGGALLFNVSEAHTLRLYATATDFAFSKRTEDDERDLKKSYALGFVGRLYNQEPGAFSFLEYYARTQSEMQRRSLVLNQDYLFKDAKLGLRGRYRLSEESQFINFDISYKTRSEGEVALSTGTNAEGEWDSQLINSLLQYEDKRWLGGVAFIDRVWTRTSEKVRLSTVQPHVWFKFYTQDADQETLMLGYEVSWSQLDDFKRSADPALEIGKEFEHRLNTRYTIHFSKDAFLHLTMTADLDDISWEGGNGTFQILF